MASRNTSWSDTPFSETPRESSVSNARSLFLIALLASAVGCNKDPKESADTSGGPPDWVIGDVVDTEGPGVLAKVDAPWGGPLWLVRVQGSHQEMGFQYGRLVGDMMMDLWWTYMEALGEEAGLDSATMDSMLGYYMDKAWDTHMGPNTPQVFHDEFQGIAEGMAAAGLEYGESDEDLVLVPRRIVTLIDLAMSSQLEFDDLSSTMDFFNDGYSDALKAYYGMSTEDTTGGGASQTPPVVDDGDDEQRGPWFNCSYFAAWGDRTTDGGLYMTRNMDFSRDTGIWEQAMVAVFVPDDAVPYASISWTGANLGILAGISEAGIAVSAVGASSPYERINTEPGVLRAREALEFSNNLEEAMPFLKNEVDDGLNRAPTIGYNALISWGDPENAGAGAMAAILETNGLEVGVFQHNHDCSVDASLLRFAADGSLDSELTSADDPTLVNSEADAKEIDIDGDVRLFAHDGEGNLLTDETGQYYEDPVDGIPIQTGYPYDCALFRGDEAMAYGVRVHQTAANGPANGNDDLMIQSGSWGGRYWPMHEMTRSYQEGAAYEWEGEEVIADNGGEQVLIGLDEAEAISRVAAMDSNVWDVVYDTTNLKIRLSYESGTGDDWMRAADQTEFLELDLRDLFLTQ